MKLIKTYFGVLKLVEINIILIPSENRSTSEQRNMKRFLFVVGLSLTMFAAQSTAGGEARKLDVYARVIFYQLKFYAVKFAHLFLKSNYH